MKRRFFDFDQKEKSKNLGYVLAFISSALYGSISTLAKPLVVDVNPLVLAAIVSLLAGAIFTPISGKSNLNLGKRNYGLIILVAVLGSVLAPSFYFFGLEDTTASDATILSNSEIVFSIILAVVFFRERLGKIGIGAVLIVFFGIFLVTTNFQFSNLMLNYTNFGNILILATMICWAFDDNFSKMLTKTVNISRIIQLRSVIGGLILLAIVLILGIPLEISFESIPSILILGIVSMVVPLFFFYHALMRIGVVRTIMIFSTSSIFGVIYAAIFLGEQIHQYQIIALAIMIFGILILHRDKT